MSSCTIASNSVIATAGDGGGILNYDFSPMQIENSIIAGNTTLSVTNPDVNGVFSSQGYNLIGKTNGSTGWGGTGDQLGSIAAPINPKLGPLQDNGGPTFTMALLPGSPAIDQGGGFGVETLDQQQTTGANAAGSLDQWQSFTAGQSGLLTKIALSVSSPVAPASSPGTIAIYAGEGTGGALLASAAVTFAAPHTFQTFALPSPPLVTVGNQYTIRFTVPAITVGWVYLNPSNPYAGGRASPDPSWDYLFQTYVEPQINADQRGWPRPFDFPAIANAGGGDASDIGAFEVNVPVLSIALSGGNALLSWSTNYPGYALETSPSLNPSAWTLVPGTPAIIGNQYVLSAGSATSSRFFALTPYIPGSALSFDGISGNVGFPDVTHALPQGTVELWFNANAWNWNAAPNGLFLWAGGQGSPNSSAGDGINLGNHRGYSATGQLMFGISEFGSFNNWHWAKSGVVPAPGAWYHVAGTWGPGGLAIYVNGVLAGTDPTRAPPRHILRTICWPVRLGPGVFSMARLMNSVSGTWPAPGADSGQHEPLPVGAPGQSGGLLAVRRRQRHQRIRFQRPGPHRHPPKCPRLGRLDRAPGAVTDPAAATNAARYYRLSWS